MRNASLPALSLLVASLAIGCDQRHDGTVDTGRTDTSVTDSTSDLGNDIASDIVTPPNDVAEDVPSSEVALDVSEPDASDVAPDAVVNDDVAPDAIDIDASTGDDVEIPDSGPWMPLGTGACNARQRAVPVQPWIHVDPDAGPITWWTNPPSSGPHYPIWAHWGTFPEIPPGYWVHNLEHAGVVFLYRCPSGSCDSTAQSLTAVVDTIPTDPVCMPSDADPTRVRVVVTHYEPMDTAIGAAAAGWLYQADCVDPATLRQFYIDHSGLGPENFCSDGYYP